MNFGIRFRLTALCLGLGLMGVLIVAVILNSQKQADELRERLNHMDREYFSIADHFHNSMRDASDRMRAYRVSRDPLDWERFVKSSTELAGWVDQQAPRLTERERNIVKEIDAAHADYLRAAQVLHDRVEAGADLNGTRPEAIRFIDQSRKLADLGLNLARAHYDSRDQVLANAHTALAHLRLSVLGLLALLFLFGVALAISVYSQMIAPLRVKLVQSQALAEQNEKLASLGMLAAGVAHEIRNPLTAIKAALFIQQKKFPAGSAERADVQVVEREILRLERIVNQFLQFARPKDPELALIPAELPLREVDSLMAAQLSKNGVQLIREPGAGLHIKADLEQIKQVLINLVQNAADSIEGSGKIWLRIREDRRRLRGGETDVAILEVADTGKGIAPEVEKRLFDPFFTTKESGTGLGLCIAARIVEKHSGALQYQTQMSHGTTFGVILPQVRV
jgi:signal transduction histidine kinase